jgi:hypothetical protein
MPRNEVQIDVRDLLFPIVGGVESAEGFRRSTFLGTGFFVSLRGLALTAGHVVMDLADGLDVRAALPTPDGPMRPMTLLWRVQLPKSDIAVIRVQVPQNRCFATRFTNLVMGQDVQTTAPPASMLVTDPRGGTIIQMRVVKGYVSHGNNESIFASFALPKGMSGAPIIVTDQNSQFVAGVFVGQNRGEEIEDQITDVSEVGPGATRIHTEKVSRIEYFARGDLLLRFKDFVAPEFEGLTLKTLIARELEQ